MGDLSVLRTAKLALDEGLIDNSDYNVVKEAFVRAQQIKAGMEAGFLREDDYVQARDAFLHALSFQVTSNGNGVAAPLPPRPAPAPATASRPAPAPSRAPAAAASAPQYYSAPSSPSPYPAPGAGPSAAPAPAAARTRAKTSSAGGAGPAPTPQLLQDLPIVGRPVAVAGKLQDLPFVGSSTAEESVPCRGSPSARRQSTCSTTIKTNSAFKWVLYKIDDQGSEVIIEEVGPSSSTFDDFTAVLPEAQCRYAVFDYAYTNAETQHTINKLVFISWAPDTANIRTKMMYASTKDFFKGFLDGVGAEVQATELHEVSEAEVRERVHQTITRK